VIQADIFNIPGAISKMVTVKIEDPQIVMNINIPNENLTCGWLISEIQKRYTEALVQHNQ
jgi:hypothetical protein